MKNKHKIIHMTDIFLSQRHTNEEEEYLNKTDIKMREKKQCERGEKVSIARK